MVSHGTGTGSVNMQQQTDVKVREFQPSMLTQWGPRLCYGTFHSLTAQSKIRINGDILEMNRDVNVDNTSISLIFTIKVLLEFFTLTLSQHM